MSIRCPKGTKEQYRYKTYSSGKKVRLGGCARKGKFIKGGVKEVKSYSKYKSNRGKGSGWYGESDRHRLARFGISSKKKTIPLFLKGGKLYEGKLAAKGISNRLIMNRFERGDSVENIAYSLGLPKSDVISSLSLFYPHPHKIMRNGRFVNEVRINGNREAIYSFMGREYAITLNNQNMPMDVKYLGEVLRAKGRSLDMKKPTYRMVRKGDKLYLRETRYTKKGKEMSEKLIASKGRKKGYKIVDDDSFKFGELQYIVYLGGTPFSFKTRKERDLFWADMKKEGEYKITGRQSWDNYKDYMWKRTLKIVDTPGSFFKSRGSIEVVE